MTATLQEDFENLWTEDVFEFFLWTDERYPVYFEYEISPLNKELPILIPNFDGQFLGWRPWHYDQGRRTQKAVSIIDGPQQSGGRDWRMACRSVCTLRTIAAPAKRAASARDALACQLLSS